MSYDNKRLSTYFFNSVGFKFLNLPNTSKCSLTVNTSNRISCYGHTPMFYLIASMFLVKSLFKIKAVPSVGVSIPYNILKSVVFPAPLWPKRANI
jgi:hypothetical protein